MEGVQTMKVQQGGGVKNYESVGGRGVHINTMKVQREGVFKL